MLLELIFSLFIIKFSLWKFASTRQTIFSETIVTRNTTCCFVPHLLHRSNKWKTSYVARHHLEAALSPSLPSNDRFFYSLLARSLDIFHAPCIIAIGTLDWQSPSSYATFQRRRTVIRHARTTCWTTGTCCTSLSRPHGGDLTLFFFSLSGFLQPRRILFGFLRLCNLSDRIFTSPWLRSTESYAGSFMYLLFALEKLKYETGRTQTSVNGARGDRFEAFTNVGCLFIDELKSGVSLARGWATPFYNGPATNLKMLRGPHIRNL